MSDDVRDPGCPVEAVTTGGQYQCDRLIGHSGPHSWPYPDAAAREGGTDG